VLELRKENLAFVCSNRQRFVLLEPEVNSLELLSHSYSALGNYSEAESLLKAALERFRDLAVGGLANCHCH